jgi:hypothetical protein
MKLLNAKEKLVKRKERKDFKGSKYVIRIPSLKLHSYRSFAQAKEATEKAILAQHNELKESRASQAEARQL